MSENALVMQSVKLTAAPGHAEFPVAPPGWRRTLGRIKDALATLGAFASLTRPRNLRQDKLWATGKEAGSAKTKLSGVSLSAERRP
jgi:hypothetical protein